MKKQLETIALFGTLTALLVGFGALIAPGYLYVFAALSLVMNLGAYFFSDRVVLRMHGATEVPRERAPELHSLVEELAQKAQIPKPKVFVIAEEAPNAFATGRNPEHGVVAVTEGILRVLNERELRGVIAHELAHIKNRDILISSVAAAIASLISYAAQALTFGSLMGGSSSDEEGEGSSPLAGLLVALVAPIAATVVQLGISRSREYLADETGARISGDPEALARALTKLESGAAVAPPVQTAPATASLFIVNPLGAMDRLSKLFSTHPDTAERVRRLQALAVGVRRSGNFPVVAGLQRRS
jgi:heat shock protein HtpX